MHDTVSVINGRDQHRDRHHPRRQRPGRGGGRPRTTGTVYVTNAVDNTVSVINGRTNTVTATIPVGSDRSGWR